MKSYVAAKDGFVNGRYYEKNADLGVMTDAEAKYLLMNGNIKEAKKPRTTASRKIKSD